MKANRNLILFGFFALLLATSFTWLTYDSGGMCIPCFFTSSIDDTVAEVAPEAPATVDSLFYWFDATDASTITSTNNKVTQWNDKSGNGYHVLQADTSKAPTLSASGGPNSEETMTFDGTDDYLASAAHWWGSDDLTVFIVYKNANATLDAVEQVINRFDDQLQWAITARASVDSYNMRFAAWKDDTGSNLKFISDGAKSTSFRIISITSDGVGGYSWYNDGVVNSTTEGTGGTGDWTITDGSSALYVSYLSSCFQGSISEIIVYSKALSNYERWKVETYLNNKYALFSETTPDQVDSLFYWYDVADATTVTTDNGKITQLEDKSGNGYDVVQADTSKAPTYSATAGSGSSPTMTFDGTDDFLASAAHWWGSDDFTYIIVAANDNTSFTNTQYMLLSDPNGIRLNFNGAQSRRIDVWTYSNASTYHLAYRNEDRSSTSFVSWVVINDGTASPYDNFTFYEDGVSLTPILGFDNGGDGSTYDADRVLKCGVAFAGSISEIIVYSADLSTANRQAIEAYLNRKYSLY